MERDTENARGDQQPNTSTDMENHGTWEHCYDR